LLHANPVGYTHGYSGSTPAGALPMATTPKGQHLNNCGCNPQHPHCHRQLPRRGATSINPDEIRGTHTSCCNPLPPSFPKQTILLQLTPSPEKTCNLITFLINQAANKDKDGKKIEELTRRFTEFV